MDDVKRMTTEEIFARRPEVDAAMVASRDPDAETYDTPNPGGLMQVVDMTKVDEELVDRRAQEQWPDTSRALRLRPPGTSLPA